MTRRLAALLVLSLSVAACGIEVGDVRAGPTPTCDTTSRGLLILMAQAVPSAELIPCLKTLPDGWVMERAEVETGSAELSIDGGNVGDIGIELVAACEPRGESLQADPILDLAAFEQTADDVVTRYYTFAGGCVTVVAPNRLAATEMTGEISFLSRGELRTASGLGL